MDIFNVEELFPNMCIIFTLIMFATGIPQCWQMTIQKSTKNIPFLVYLMTNINNLSWIIYAQMTNNPTVIFVNTVGSILHTIYMFVYVYYSTDKFKNMFHSFLGLISVMSGWFLATRVLNGSPFAINASGLVCCCITVLMFSSPLSEIKTVYKEKSTASISFPLTATTFLVGISWTLYGISLNDNYIIIPNLLGMLTSIVRFYFFYKYPFKPSSMLPH